MYAVVDIQGKQFKVNKADRLYVPKLERKPGDVVEFSSVKLFSKGKTIKVGAPVLDNVTVKATVLEHVKDDKVIVFKKKRRKGYRKMVGHRQEYTHIEINDIVQAKTRRKDGS